VHTSENHQQADSEKREAKLT